MRVLRRVLAAFAVLAALPATTRADIALEAYAGERPTDADLLVAPLRAALARHHVLTRPSEIVEVVGPYVPLSGNPDRSVTRTKLIEQIDIGLNRAVHEAYEDAVVILESVFRDLERNPAIAASDPASRAWVTKGRVALAFAYGRSKRSKLATDIVLEHIRSYPELSLEGEQEDVERLYSANRAVLAGKRGKLVFRVNRPDAVIFVNEVERGRGALETDLIPGEYRIVVLAAGVYRRYGVTVRADKLEERAVDWSVDGAFTVTPAWIGFVYAPAARSGVTEFVRQLARRNPSDAVIVFGVAERDGQRFLTAQRYTGGPTERPGRAVALAMAAGAMETLVAYVTTPEGVPAVSPALIAMPGETAPQAAASAPRPPPRWPVIPALAVFAAAVPAGGYFIKTDRNCHRDCSSLDGVAGWSLFGLGGLALGFGAYWLIHADRAVLRVAVGVAPGGGMATLQARF